MKMSNYIATFENYFSDQYCDDIIKWFEDKSDFWYKENKFRNDISLFGPYGHKSFNDIDKGLLSKNLVSAFKEYSDYYLIVEDERTLYPSGLQPIDFNINDVKIQKSEKGTGFTSYHCEYDVIKFPDRIMVWMLYLNDVNKGGKTEFFSGEKITPKRGTLLLWPPYYTHTHRAAADLNETKYIMTGWYRHPGK